MSSDPSTALRDLRDTLRQPLSSTEALTSALSLVLSPLDLHPTSVPPSSASAAAVAAIQRYLPTIQLSLLTDHLPTFLHALGEDDLLVVERFFCPPKSATLGALRVGRTIAGVSYTTLPSLLSSKSAGGAGSTALPAQSRDHLLSSLDKLAATYGIDDLYWSIWASGGESQAESSKDGGLRALRWEEAVKAVTSLPARVANAAGRWGEEGWKGIAPAALASR